MHLVFINGNTNAQTEDNLQQFQERLSVSFSLLISVAMVGVLSVKSSNV